MAPCGGLSNTSVTNISSSALASFLDGAFSFSLHALPTPSASGNAATVIIREPISGTYNTMEYNTQHPNAADLADVVSTNQPVGSTAAVGSALLAQPTR